MVVTTKRQKWPKIGTSRVKRSFFAKRAKKASAKGQSPLQAPHTLGNKYAVHIYSPKYVEPLLLEAETH